MTVEQKRAWRDRLRAAVPANPATVMEASVLLEAGRASKGLGDVAAWRDTMLQIAETPASGYSNRMAAAGEMIGFSVQLEDSKDVFRALELYAEAAREKEAEPNPYRRQNYSSRKDPYIRAASYYRGQALMEDALRRSPQDPIRRELAARSLDEYGAYLESDFGADERRSYPAAKRYVLFRKGLALAILGDERGVRSAAEQMSRAPVVNARDLQEAVGYFLYKACEQIMVVESGASEPISLRIAPSGRAMLRRFESLVGPDDPYYVEYQKALASAERHDGDVEECANRLGRLLRGDQLQVRSYLEEHPRSWGNILYYYGDAQMALGRAEPARAAFQELVSRFPENGNSDIAKARLAKDW